jgi:5-hydroxyisourate hydrolase
VSVSTHVLDVALGRPAAGVPVTLCRSSNGGWESLGAGVTDVEGRLRHFGGTDDEVELRPGIHRLDFDTGSYFASTGQTGFYPHVSVAFQVTTPDMHHHVPLLLAPFAYSTYRGS